MHIFKKLGPLYEFILYRSTLQVGSKSEFIIFSNHSPKIFLKYKGLKSLYSQVFFIYSIHKMKYMEDFSMNKIKKYMIVLSIMIVVSVISLLVLSILTYLFKWQADKAMIGIIITYILAGVVGGVCIKTERRVRAAMGVGTLFVAILVLCSSIGLQIPFEFSGRLILIWLLIISSSFIGLCLRSRSR